MTKNKKKIITGALIVIILLLTINTSQAGNFTDLQTAINSAGGTLTLNDNYTDNSTGTQQITITKNIIIDGQGHTINFNYKNNNNIKIENSYTVTLKKPNINKR